MAVKNNPAIGTVHCEHCDGTRSVHMYESGRHKGKLYTRCPSCEDKAHKFISKTSFAEQRFLRSKATFKPEFADQALTLPQEETPTPKAESKVQPESEPQTPQTVDPKPQNTQNTQTRKGAGVVVAGVVGIALIVAGALAA